MSLLGNLTVGILGNMSGLSGTFKEAQNEVQKFGSNLQRIGKDISGVGDTLTRRITMPAVAAASALTGITLVKGFGRLVGIDTAQAKLKGLGHDAESVKVIMDSALASVKGTAFGMAEAATTAASAVAAGIAPGEELTRYLTLTGDAAAIAGSSMSEMGSIINKTTTAGKAYNMELQQLSDRGLPIYQWLADEAGTTADAIFDMASKGEISSEMLLNAIENNIGGAAKIMGEESFTAALANIGADISRIGANFLDAGGEAGGFFSTVKPLLTEFRGMLSSVEEMAAGWGVKFGEAFNNFINRIRELKAWFDDLSPSMQSVILKAAGIGSAFLVGIGPALKIVGGLVSGIGSLVSIFGLLTGPVGIAIAAIAALIAIGVLLYQNWDIVKEKAQEVFGAFEPLIETVKEAFQNFIDSLEPIWESLKGLFESLMPTLTAIGAMVGGVLVTAFGMAISVFNAVVSAIGPLINAAINLLDVFVNVFNAIISLMVGDFSGALDYWKKATDSSIEFFKNLWNGVVNFFATFVQTIIDFFYGLYMTLVGNSIIPDMVNAIVDWFKNMFKWITDIVKNIIDGVKKGFENMKNNIKAVFGLVKNIITTAFDFIKNTFQNTLGFLKSVVTGDFEGMKNAISNQMENVKSTITNIWNNVLSFLKGINLTDVGKNVIRGFADGISSMASSVMDKARSIADSVKNTISKALDIRSPSRVLMAIGKDVVEGFAIGIEKQIKAVASVARDMASSVTHEAEVNLSLPDVAGVLNQAIGKGRESFSGSTSSTSSTNGVSLLERLRNLVPEYIQTTINLDGKKIAEVTSRNQYTQQQSRGRGLGYT